MDGGMDSVLASHFAHLFIRDPIVIFAEDLQELDLTKTDHFENLQSTNWQHIRFKPPPPNNDIASAAEMSAPKSPWRIGASGFNALPTGYLDYGGSFSDMLGNAFFWVSTEYNSQTAWFRRLVWNTSDVHREEYNKRGGLAVRCLSDETQTTTILVPENFATIQEAIDYSIDGDTILVSAGTYYENINFNGKNIALIGEDRETTIIDGDIDENGSYDGNGVVVTIIPINSPVPTQGPSAKDTVYITVGKVTETVTETVTVSR